MGDRRIIMALGQRVRLRLPLIVGVLVLAAFSPVVWNTIYKLGSASALLRRHTDGLVLSGFLLGVWGGSFLCGHRRGLLRLLLLAIPMLTLLYYVLAGDQQRGMIEDLLMNLDWFAILAILGAFLWGFCLGCLVENLRPGSARRRD